MDIRNIPEHPIEVAHRAYQENAIKGLFTLLAPYYDRGNRALSLGQDQLWRRKAARLAQTRGPGLVLDVATGTADLALAMACHGNQVIALDLCPEMMTIGRQKAAGKRVRGRIGFVLAEAHHLPFPDNTFDAVTIGFALRNITVLSSALIETRRVLKAGARLVSLELSPPHQGPLAAIHRCYLRHGVPTLGRWLSGQGKAYKYLASSVSRFYSSAELASLLRQVGYRHVKTFHLGMGAAMAHIATK